ncbi:serine/threonine-protein kinase [Hyalangium sp.]|uniref:serine/threonine-protein kinase n=1 Tax=Hyalangium sp. TaxID=2028555 RepID=UPI002D287B24|nr:protein kinase [Hyalangium sp.]HYH96924.1 protein kinase [Hyalangium sp.]
MSPSATAEIRIGTVLRDTYELTSLLGKGGMGSVFLARHLRLPGKQVAVKVLLHSDDLSEEQFARFRREAEIASQLGHPNIVEVLDFHSLEDGTPYMVMEHLRGESLAQRLRKGRMSMREAFSVARQMGSALQAAHRAGVVHRDLKPANVFLVPTDSEGMVTERVKLLDFGISKLMGSQTLQTQEDVLMGTPRYMAPEQAMGRNRDVDSRSDIFAFGCIVYEMLCGDSPFAGGTIAEVVYRVVHEQPESLASRMPDLPGRAVSAVDRALAKAPKDRYPDVATFIAELTGTALQSLSGLGADPTPFPPRGAIRQNDPSVNEEEGTDATFVPSRSGVAGAVGSPAPQTPAATPEPSVERGSTLAAFRFAEQQASAQPAPSGMSVSRRPTDLEMPAAVLPAAQPSAVLGPSAQPSSASSHPATPGLDAQPRLAPAPSRSKSPLILAAIGGVLLLAGGIVVGGKMLPPSNPPGPVTPPPAVTPPETATPPTPSQPTVPPETTPPVTPPPVNPTVTAGSSAPSTARPVKPETIPEEVRQELAEAEKALASGELDQALRIARRTQQTKATEAANYLIGRVYCQRKDLGNAKAQWRSLTGSNKSKLTAYCRKYEIDL